MTGLLFTDNCTTLTERSFSVALGALGITEGDAVMVHSDLARFGKLSCAGDVAVSSLTGVLKGAVGSGGSILMPTFNYDFCNGIPFDPKTTRPMTGAWGRRLLSEQDVYRSSHPIYSMAVWDPTARGFANKWDDSFGRGSPFERLHQQRGKLIFWGVGIESCTFIHYVEQCYTVPYRFMKAFNVGRQWCTMYARDLTKGLSTSLVELGRRLVLSGEMSMVRVGTGTISAVSADAMWCEAIAMLDADIYSLTKPERTDRE